MIMNCHKTIEDNSVNEELFQQEIKNVLNCISICLKINTNDIKEIINEKRVRISINGRMNTLCKRIVFDYGSGTLDCCMSLDFKFIEIFHS